MVAFEITFWACFKTNFFRIAGSQEVETSMSGEAACLLAVGVLYCVNLNLYLTVLQPESTVHTYINYILFSMWAS